MEKQNVTLSVRKDLLHKAELLADERGLSLSALLAELLGKAVEQANHYSEAKRRQLVWMEEGFDLGVQGVIDWKREDLYER